MKPDAIGDLAPLVEHHRAAHSAELSNVDDVIRARFNMTNKAGPTIAKRSATRSRRAGLGNAAAAASRHAGMSRDLRDQTAELCAAASRNGAWNGRLGAERPRAPPLDPCGDSSVIPSSAGPEDNVVNLPPAGMSELR
jgi:hypothetical protein